MTDTTKTPGWEAYVHKYKPAKANNITLLLLHGTGGNENSLTELAEELLPESGILSPRGKVLENGMPRFFRRIAEGVFDEVDLRYRTTELTQWVLAAAEQYGFDQGGLVALGYSNGANIAASVLLSHPNVLAGAVLMRAMSPYIVDRPIVLPESPVLLLNGDRDPMVTLNKASLLAEQLLTAGARLKRSVVHAGHSLTEPELKTVKDFLIEFFERKANGSRSV